MSKKVAIIGGGIGGLGTAALLAQRGFDVHVYESANQLGGRAGLKKLNGYTFDTGPSWYLMPGVFDQFFGYFGTSAQKELDLIKLSPAYKVFYEHAQPIIITGDEATDVATFEAIEPGAGEALRRYIKESNDLYQMALRYFLYTNFDRLTDLLAWDIIRQTPQLFSYLTKPIHNRVASFVTDQRLQQILEYPMVFLGSSPFSAPSMYSLMSALDFKEGVYYPKRGIYDIIRSLEKIGSKQGVTVHTNAAVARINHHDGEVVGVTLESGEHVEADIVVSNAGLANTELQLLDDTGRSYKRAYFEKKEAGISALLMYLGVKKKLPELEHHNLFFVEQWRENFEAIYDAKQIPESASLYICKPTATENNLAPEGHENLFVLVPLPAGVSLSDKDLKALATRTITQIEAMAGISIANDIDTKELFGPDQFIERFGAWQGSALGFSHLLSQSAFFRTPNKSKRLKNLYYVGGDTTPGVGLPMCLISAEQVVKRIEGRKGNGAL